MIKLYLDEDVPEAIAKELRLRGYDVVTVKEAARKGMSDLDQLNYASSENRVLFSFNVADFCKINTDFIEKGLGHKGIILSKQLPIGVIVKALLRLLPDITPEKAGSNIMWLSTHIKE